MINLLPTDSKQQLKAARTNVTLVKYTVLLGIAAAFLFIACGVTYFVLTSIKTNNDSITAKSGSTVSSQSSASNQASNLAISGAILGRQVSYSAVINGIAAALPSGAILDSISLNKASFEAPISLRIYARSSDLAANLKENFLKSSLFSGYNQQSITSDSNDVAGYSTLIVIGLTINKGLVQ